MAGCQIHAVFAGIAGSHVRSLNSHGIVAIRDREVMQGDVERVIDAARAVAIPADQKILHILPQEFIIDSQDGIREPIGMSGVRLEAKVHIVTGAESAAQNIVKCVQRCGLEVEDIVLEQLASSYATLADDEKELGVCLIDIGGGTTDVAVFAGGAIRHTAVIPIAGDMVTNDIAQSLRTPTHHAEELKVKYACALSQLANADETIEVPSVGDRPARRLARQSLASVVEARYEEIFVLVRDELRALRLRRQDRGRHRADGRQRKDGWRHRTGRGDLPRAGAARAAAGRERPGRRGAQSHPFDRGRPAVVRSRILRSHRPRDAQAAERTQCRGSHEGLVPGEFLSQGAFRSGNRPGPTLAFSHSSEQQTMFVLADKENQGAIIKVVGVGGGGGNAVAHMVHSGIEGVDFVCINTDAQALKHSKVKMSLQIGSNITKGLGAGADPEVGRQAAMEDRDRIVELIDGSDMIFITAGMGGGTGTGAAPVVAQVAKELGILTVAVVTKPFEMEGAKRLALSEQGINELSKYVDSLITIPNQKLLTVLGGDTTLLDAFRSANQVLQGAVQGIAELITRPGLINVDFADVRTVMAETGMAMMGSGAATGENRARVAAEAAVSSPLLEDVNLHGAHGLLINVTAGMDLRTSEFHVVGDTVKQYASEDATVVVGYVIDAEMTDQIRVTVVATGIGRPVAKAMPQPTPMNVVQGGRRARPAAAFGHNYADLETPPHLRNRTQRAVGAEEFRSDIGDESMLDIPAFLRRQAD